MKVFALHEGSYSVDSSKKFIPFDPTIHKSSERPASLFIHVQPFIIETKNDLLVLDTGLGYNQSNGKLILHQNIINAGYQPSNVTKVLMTHLHFDHSAGMIWNNAGNIEPSFPNAEYIIQRAEWENAYSNVSKSYNTAIFDIIQRSGQVIFVEGNGVLNNEISYELSGGHSEFHQVFHIKEANEYIFFGGDELPEPEQLLRKFTAKYDFDGKHAMELRIKYGKLAAKENWTCLFYHAKKGAIAKIEENENGFIIKSV